MVTDTRPLEQSVLQLSRGLLKAPSFCRLLQETRMLQTIDKLRLAAAGPNRAARIEGALQRMAAPKEWTLTNGRRMEVQTPGTLRRVVSCP